MSRPGATRIAVHLQPASSLNEIAGYEDNVFRVKVTAPAVDGKANKAIVAYLAGLLDISKSKIRLVRGETARNKLLEIDGLNREEIISMLTPVPEK